MSETTCQYTRRGSQPRAVGEYIKLARFRGMVTAVCLESSVLSPELSMDCLGDIPHRSADVQPLSRTIEALYAGGTRISLCNKASGDDRITAEVLKHGEATLDRRLHRLFLGI